MDKKIVKRIEREKVLHEFYCDKCGKFLESVDESYDGWYPDNFLYNLEIRLNQNMYDTGTIERWWYNYGENHHFCNDCLNELVTNLNVVLETFGFTKKGD